MLDQGACHCQNDVLSMVIVRGLEINQNGTTSVYNSKGFHLMLLFVLVTSFGCADIGEINLPGVHRLRAVKGAVLDWGRMEDTLMGIQDFPDGAGGAW